MKDANIARSTTNTNNKYTEVCGNVVQYTVRCICSPIPGRSAAHEATPDCRQQNTSTSLMKY